MRYLTRLASGGGFDDDRIGGAELICGDVSTLGLLQRVSRVATFRYLGYQARI